jgi:hypothetical protein
MSLRQSFLARSPLRKAPTGVFEPIGGVGDTRFSQDLIGLVYAITENVHDKLIDRPIWNFSLELAFALSSLCDVMTI